MHIQRQCETFAYRFAADADPYDNKKLFDPFQDVSKQENINGHPQGDSTAPYEAAAEAEANRAGPKEQKFVPHPEGSVGSGGGGGASSGGNAGFSTSSFDPKQWKSPEEYARSMNGKPYNYGGAGNGNVDCSGFMSNIYSIYTGKPTRFTTDSDFSKLGFEPGYAPGLFNVGTNGGVGENGHMAGTLPDGTKVECNGSAGAQYGGNAIGATDFNSIWHLPASAPSTPTIPSTPSPQTTPMAGPITSMRRK